MPKPRSPAQRDADLGRRKMGKGPNKGPRWVWVRCPTCRGKGTKGFDKNGPKPCPLCENKDHGKILVPQT